MNFVLGDVDLNFHGQTFETLISRKRLHALTFLEADIRRGMTSVRMFYSTTLTYICKVKEWKGNISDIELAQQCVMYSTEFDICHRVTALWILCYLILTFISNSNFFDYAFSIKIVQWQLTSPTDLPRLARPPQWSLARPPQWSLGRAPQWSVARPPQWSLDSHGPLTGVWHGPLSGV